MAEVIISQNGQGGVSITSPSKEFTPQEILDKGGLGNFARIVDTSDLPEHPEFSDAWEMDANTITVNIDKAREITKVRLRNERAPLLAAQDVLFMKAQETGADTTAIVAEKNRLRNITQVVDSTTTLEELLTLTCGQ
jgi:hypothetical protein